VQLELFPSERGLADHPPAQRDRHWVGFVFRAELALVWLIVGKSRSSTIKNDKSFANS
jgi:hypothetical protein